MQVKIYEFFILQNRNNHIFRSKILAFKVLLSTQGCNIASSVVKIYRTSP